jgi:hypothetical protein
MAMRHLGRLWDMSKPRTRFVATVDGELRELFSVVETSDRSLIAFIRAETRGASDSWFGLQRWNTYRVSIHPSKKSKNPGILIKGTMATEIGRKIEVADFSNVCEKDILVFAFAKLCPILDSRYRKSPKNKDIIINTQSFSIHDNCTLIYIAFVTRPHVELANPGLGFSLSSVDFSDFRLNVFTTISNIPASNVGGWIQNSTSKPRIDGGEIDEDRFEQATGLDPSKLHPFLLDISQRISALTLSTLITEYPDFNWILEAPIWFHKDANVLRSSRIARGGF